MVEIVEVVKLEESSTMIAIGSVSLLSFNSTITVTR